MKKGMRTKIEAATVRLPRRDGQGVLVPGHMIVTAAHVIEWSTEGGMALGDYHIEEMEARNRALKVQPLAVEPVSDLAILGALDDQVFPDEADAFEVFCESTAPVPIYAGHFPLRKSFPVHILAHTGEWIVGQAEQYWPNAPSFSIKTRAGIEGGTSGGPVVTNGGRLLGVASMTIGGRLIAPRLHMAAPTWLVQRMVDPGYESRKMQEYLKSQLRRQK